MKLPLSEIWFTYARSSGPGGQNVNKVNSKAVLHWYVEETKALSPGVKARFLSRYGNRLNSDGELVLQSDRYRDQPRNKQDCLDRLESMLQSVARPPKRRKATKPSKGAKERRLKSKRKHGDKKKSRQQKFDEH